MTLCALEFSPPDPAMTGAVCAGLLLAWVLMRWLLGSTAPLAQRWSLRLLRAAALVIIALILAGPVRVTESPGDLKRPDVFLLLDASQSMGIGTDRSRWEDAVSTVQAAVAEESPDLQRNIKPFRFGHRLAALDQSLWHPELDASASAAPSDSDTRLAEALRQLTSRFGRTLPAAVVLLSDGRVHDAASTDELSRHYGSKNLPIHVYPLGGTETGGDVALISVVAPPVARKFSSINLQVFLRSFGFEGQRTELLVLAENPGGAPPTELVRMPITLRGGIQSVPLTYRSDIRDQNLRIVVPTEEGEISSRNNELTAEVAIERTKIRVLYVEGSDEPLRAVREGDQYVWDGPHRAIQDALMMDEDIECVTLVPLVGSNRLQRLLSPQSAIAARGFPDTQAELAAFDAIILSNVSEDTFEPEHLEWIASWVGNRGGGLCMLGGPESYASGRWQDSPLADVLPVVCVDERWSPGADVAIDFTSIDSSHAAWNIVADRDQNQKILRALPVFRGTHLGLAAKPSADVLASADVDGQSVPVLAAGPYGRGRSLTLAVQPVGSAARDFLTAWGAGNDQYSSKFWRNIVYWVTENSTIGRRRLVAEVDKRFYRPGETIELSAVAYDESAHQTTNYSLWGMVEPRSLDFDIESIYSSVRWPNGVPRESGEEGPHIAWGEEFELQRDSESGRYYLPLEIAQRLRSGTDNQGLRIELTAYENTSQSLGFSRGTQVDSTSLDVQIIHDPFEQQNPFPNHDLLARVADLSGGKVLHSPQDLTEVIRELPVTRGPPIVRAAPVWSQWPLLAALIGLLSAEWFFRRSLGLA